MKKILSILLLLCPAVICAQSYSMEYGKVTVGELKETEYLLDSEAEAAVIYETGDYRFRQYETAHYRPYELQMTVTTKIKIYNEAGLDYANVEIPYYTSGDPETIIIEGCTYNLDEGQITSTKLSSTNIYTEKLGSDRSIEKIAFPDVRAGSVIELKYTITTRHYFNMRTWRFQKKIPVYHSRLTYIALPFYDYAFIVSGLKKFDEQSSRVRSVQPQLGSGAYRDNSYQEKEYVFGMNRLPAFRDEEFLLDTDDYMSNIHFELASYYSYTSGLMIDLITTWPKLSDELLKDADFGKYIDDSEKAAKTILPEIGLEGKNDLEKFEAICEYVKYKYTWNGGVSKYAEKKLSAFLKDKTGSSGNINLFMAGLMKAAGLDVYPVAVSTQKNGKIYKDYPFLTSLNDVVVMANINGESYFADASAALTRYDELPARNTNVEGLMIKKKEPAWVMTGQNEVSADSREVSMKILPAEGKIKAEMKQTLRGNAAYVQRSTYNGDIEKLKDEYKGNEGMSIAEIGTENFNETGKPFVINMKYDLSTGPAGEQPDKIFVNPLLYLAPADTPFKQARRTHPVNLIFSSVDNFLVEIEIPEGYGVEYLPPEYIRSNNIMQISYKPLIEGDTIKLTAGFAMKDFYDTKDYAGLKTMYEGMVRAFSEVIILKKN